MDTAKLTLGDRVNIFKRKASSWFMSKFIDDTPPAMHERNGKLPPTADYLKAFSEAYPLFSLLPYEAYDEAKGLYYNFDSVGFLIEANPVAGMSTTEVSVLNGIFSQQHRAQTRIQVSLYADQNCEPILNAWKDFGKRTNSVPDELRAIFNTVEKKRVDYLRTSKWKSLFADQSTLMRDYRLIIAYTWPIEKGVRPIDLPEQDQEELVRTREQIMGTLRSAKIHCRPMQPERFINLMDGMLNPSSKPKSHIEYDDLNPINRQCVDVDTKAEWGCGSSSITHQDESFSVLTYQVKQFPRWWSATKAGKLIGSLENNILRISCPFLMTLTVKIPDQVTRKSSVKINWMNATRMLDTPVGKKEPRWKDRASDWEFTAKKVDGGDKLLSAFFQVVLFAPTGHEEAAGQSLKACFDSFGWELMRCRHTPVPAFLAALPMAITNELELYLDRFKFYRSRLSWTCTNIAPWVAEWKGLPSPKLLFFGRRGQLTTFDSFANDKGNYNTATVATSGAGKSFSTAEKVMRTLSGGGRSFIIDAGHSYRNLCALLQGTYIDAAERGIIFNPFSWLDDSDPEYFLQDEMPQLIPLMAQMASPDRPLTQKQKTTLEKGIQRAWLTKKTKATITTVYEQLNEEKDQTAQDLAAMLYSYTKHGMYGRFMEGEANINLDNRFVVLDLSALNSMPDFQAVVLLLLMMRINHAFYNSPRDVEKTCDIDEAWRLMGTGSAGAFIEEGYRVARKFKGSFNTITQKISDYYSSETARAALMNSDYTIYLRMKLEEIGLAEAAGQIDNSDGKVDLLRSLETVQGQYSELAISGPDGIAVLRFIVDPFSQKLYSTTPDDVEFLYQAQKRGMSIEQAVEALNRRQNPAKAA